MENFYIGATLSFDISIDVSCDNYAEAIQEGLRKLGEYAVAILELKLQLHDGTVIAPKVYNWSNGNEEIVAIEDEEGEMT